MDRKQLAAYAFAALLMGSLWGVVMWNYGGVYSIFSSGSMKRFASYEELNAFVSKVSTGFRQGYDIFGMGLKLSTNALTASQVESTEAPDFSGTNIQVEGVDEADVVKTDGEYIYIVSEGSVIIVKAYPAEEAEVLSRIVLNETVGEIFVNGDKLVLFLTPTEVFYIIAPRGGSVYPWSKPATTIQIYDISDRTRPKLDRSLTVDGYYFSSRMIGDYAYIVTNQPAYLNESEVILPTISAGGFSICVQATSIYYANFTDQAYAFTNVVAVNVIDPRKPISHETFLLGATSNLYVSTNSIYIAIPRYEENKLGGTYGTMIHRIGVDRGKITYLSDGFVPGWVLNQFSMDEYDGYFRIATTIGYVWGWSKSKNNVYILDSNLNVVGRVEGLAPGEQIYSARFMGKRCYLVTFRKVDPLFVIDLQDPMEPRVLGKLKIPGYSDYLHPYDEDHLIGVGKETVDAEEGDFSWYQGVKISLFDVSDIENPIEIAKYEIGDRGTDSPVLRDHKAFLFSHSKNLLVIPVLEAEIDPARYSGKVPPNAYGEYVYQGAYVFSITPTKGITLRGRVTHMDSAEDLVKSGFYFESPYSVERALYIEDILYTISGKMIKMNSLATLKEINRLNIS